MIQEILDQVVTRCNSTEKNMQADAQTHSAICRQPLDVVRGVALNLLLLFNNIISFYHEKSIVGGVRHKALAKKPCPLNFKYHIWIFQRAVLNERDVWRYRPTRLC
jgi:hypothetical protein